MHLAPCPAESAWRHHTVRDAVEVVAVERHHGSAGWALRGHTTGCEDRVPYASAWEVVVGPDWVTRRAHVRSLVPGREGEVTLERSASGSWRVDGVERPELAAAVDVDLEVSAVTNTLPVHRERLDRATAAPAAYVRIDLGVELLGQTYGPATAADGRLRVPYRAPAFDVDVVLELDDAGLVVDYPGLAVRVR